MPSSSNHDTWKEEEILDNFKQGFVRFYYKGFRAEASEVCQIYSNLLELPQETLTDHFKNEDEAEWARLKKRIQSKKTSESVWTISRSFSDTAEVLIQCGRHEEGKQFYVYAKHVQKLAEALYAEEENRK
ncbi:uncharacterized protein RCC_07703 [Ramularia collo-cygni]|uniref:Uncharacterized protein n=1 Tax=Ramularia collo-cygni TaxID=112498 RepID=A0A2D3VDG4_9PEZI|nr:uncharacterized protein RCC_07703 [Ramularia collo-cygni]CZT21836.1 uncharacterized protein RCC_07703 [Ramularia collo-cygni]